MGYAGNDIVGGPVHRHTYRHGGGAFELNGFVLVKAEHGKKAEPGGEDWQVVWEARSWTIPDR